ncbi:tetratricopeptide repeat protein [Pseudoduganella eburnea]|uniref:Tetratricopeptide repeat protein n=2 Tax=Massilia eburnea TaxID=1776165 RepID=A0A6L6QIA1_9BURK|nr:tetratricopeptide repeat protein [Massilia eburnea]
MQASQFSSRTALALGAALFMACISAQADEVSDINKMLRAGQLPAALAKVDVALSQHPKDAQLRFIKGMILSEQGKSADAINIFQKLTEDYPELPEPYNNLAVLHASAGNYDKARVALERAIRTNPTYATAHENLGDVYAKLASQSYDKAMQLADPTQQPPQKSKLAMVRTLAPKGGEAPSVLAAIAAPPPAPAKAAPAPVIAQSAPSAAKAAPPAPVQPPVVAQAKPAPAPAQAKPIPVAPPAAAPAPAVQLAKAASKPEPKPEAVKKEDTDGADVNKAVENWAKAWSSQDMKGYLNSYSGNFQTPKGQNRKAWEADRTARIEGKGHIKVTIESPQITVNGNTATVKFRQKYVSDRLSTTGRKTLVLEKQGKNWLIKQEQSGG